MKCKLSAAALAVATLSHGSIARSQQPIESVKASSRM